jgi:hypothetical protein
MIEPGARSAFRCGESGTGSPEIFASLSGGFTSSGAEPGTAAKIAAGSPQRKAREGQDDAGSGVLPAVTDGLSKIPEALPELQVPSDSSSPSSIIGLGALLLLALSGLALLLYVVRFLRGPHTT